jgi:hypothetical protein
LPSYTIHFRFLYFDQSAGSEKLRFDYCDFPDRLQIIVEIRPQLSYRNHEIICGNTQNLVERRSPDGVRNPPKWAISCVAGWSVRGRVTVP